MRLLGALVAAGLVWGQEPAAVVRGRTVFSSSCGIGYCHGKDGGAGRGPRLAGKKFDREYLLKVVTQGVNNSLMPAFKDQLSAADISAVVAYILTLSGSGAAEPAATGAEAAQPAEPSGPDKPIDPDAGSPAAGRALFFDASNPKRCSACHACQGRGGEAGPDLTSQAGRSPREILRDIVEPEARLAMEPLTLVTRSGERITGLKKTENGELLRIWDTAGLPPVLRTIYKDQITSRATERKSPMPAGYGRLYTRRQLLDLVAFLKSAPVAPGEIE